MSEPTRAYLGIKKCGCTVAIMCADASPGQSFSDHAKWVATELKAWERSGLTVELVATEEAKKRVAECEHKRTAKQKEMFR